MRILKLELTQPEFHEIAKSTRNTDKGPNHLHLLDGTLEKYENHSFDIKFTIKPFNCKIICYSDNKSYSTELISVDAFTDDDFKLTARIFLPNIFGNLK